MFFCILLFSIILGSGEQGSAAAQAKASTSEEYLSRLTQYINAGQLDQAREAIKEDPARSKETLQALIAQFDSSIHSFRDKPEQRRVQYSQSFLEVGLKLSSILAEVTHDDSCLRRFQARRDRMTATALLNEKQYQKALDVTQSVRKTALELEDKSFLFSTYLTSAYAYLGLDKREQTLADCETALRLAREISDPAKMALGLFNLGTAYLHAGRIRESLPYSVEAAETAAKVGNKLWEANAQLNAGSAEMMLQDYESGEKALRQALRLAQEVGDRLAEGRARYNLGVLYHNWGRWEAASDYLEHSLQFIRTVDIRHSHDIDAYNYVEKDALELLLHSYREMNRNDAAVESVRARLEELKDLPKKQRRDHSH
ncbi:MAG: tetratricopeptide repeat protein [Acidobacteria bacterium]|nr:tetratricopeptide repeat protein [Acidobacteriota bacterium]